MLACTACKAPIDPQPEGPAVAISRVAIQDLPCTDPCGMKLTYETRLEATGQPVAAELTLTGDGWHPARVQSTLPEGRVTFYWEYPRPRVSGTQYRLDICPQVGRCTTATATIYLPE